MNNLSPKQESFAQEYVKSGNASESYRKAGYKGNNVRQLASQLLTNIDVQKRVQELQEVGKKEFEVTKEFLYQKYMNLHDLHMEGQGAVAKGSLDSIAKMFGLNEPEKLDVTTQGDKINQIDMTQLSEETLKDLANATKPKD